jgi:hypothetical protein
MCSRVVGEPPQNMQYLEARAMLFQRRSNPGILAMLAAIQ